MASFTLAVERQKKGETDFIPIVVWQKQAESCSQYLTKGRMAAIDGRLQIRTYENKDGQKVKVAEVVAESVQFLDRGEKNAQSTGSSKPEPVPNKYNDDPFADSDVLDIDDQDLPF